MEPIISGQVVVYGGTASGVMAAVAAARNGSNVLLLEPGQHLGGMVSGGLGVTDAREFESIGGYAKEFWTATDAYYRDTYGALSPPHLASVGGLKYEPHVAELLFERMVSAEKRISVFYGAELLSVSKTGSRIEAFKTVDGKNFAGNVFVDATYEGDLLAAAGVSFAVGRESAADYGETHAGLQIAYPWPEKVSGKSNSGRLLPFLHSELWNPIGTGLGDKKVQAYCYRMCLTQRVDNLRPIVAPENYDEADYELLARYLDITPETTLSDLFVIRTIPNDKVDVNSYGNFSSDLVGGSWTYPEANATERLAIARKHRDYQLGLLYFLAHSSRVSPALRAETATWGLARDEFEDNENWPYQLYVREARRMIGQYVMTEHDGETRTNPSDSIALASYMFDSHHVQRVLTTSGLVINEGATYGFNSKPFGIPYRAILPLRSEASNLLVSGAISATHVLYGAYRMEIHYMHVGQAAGTAASLAVNHLVEPGDVPIADLQETLKAQGALIRPAE